jgi:integrase
MPPSVIVYDVSVTCEAMARTTAQPKINTPNQRLKLEALPNGEPYWYALGEGRHLGYCKGKNQQGTWRARYYSRELGRKFEAIGTADDKGLQADGVSIFSFEQAQDKARNAFKRLALSDETDRSPYTVSQAMADYVADRERAKRRPLLATRSAINAHIEAQLGGILLAKLTKTRVRQWFHALASSAPHTRTGFVKERRMVERNVNGKIKRQYRERVVRDAAGNAMLLEQATSKFDPTDPESQRKRQATANRILTILKAGLNHAVKENNKDGNREAWADVRPFHKVDVPKIVYLEVDEVPTMMNACATDDFRSLVQGALLTGCRYGELTQMLVEHFDPQQEQVYVAESKNGEARYVELSPQGVEFFAALASGRKGKEHLFLKADGTTWKKSEQKRPMDEAVRISGIDKPITFHVMRHSYASQLAMNGTDMRTIADMLGHKDTRITERHYAHLSRKHKRDTIRRNLPVFEFSSGKTIASHKSF